MQWPLVQQPIAFACDAADRPLPPPHTHTYGRTDGIPAGHAARLESSDVHSCTHLVPHCTATQLYFVALIAGYAVWAAAAAGLHLTVSKASA